MTTVANQTPLESAFQSLSKDHRPKAEAATRPRGPGREALACLEHEFRTPLQVLFGYIEILQEDWAEKIPAEPRRILNRMRSNVYELTQTAENLLEFVEGETGAQACVQEDIAIGDLIEEIRPVLEAANSVKGLELTFDLDEPPLTIRSERRRLRSILSNLALNAIKFTAAGAVTMAVRRAEAGPDEAVEFEVRDTGLGIDPAVIEAAFEPFSQLSRSSVRRFRGLGLGLALVRRNAVALGGTLIVRSTPQVGSSFVIRLPDRRHRTGSQQHETVHRAAPGSRLGRKGARYV